MPCDQPLKIEYMDHPHDVGQWLTDLEIKATITEDLLDQLAQRSVSILIERNLISPLR